jgi:hypothetical protein
VIHVRYKELSPGLHGKTERSGRGTTVYLLPGLTGRQRKAALRRLRQEASRGLGPELRRPDLAVALAADRFRAGVRNTAAVVRLHPAGSLLPAALAAALMTLFVLAPVGAKMMWISQSAPTGGLFPGRGAPAVTPVFVHGNRTDAPGGSGEHSSGCGQAGGRADDVTTGEDPALRTAWRCWPLRRLRHPRRLRRAGEHATGQVRRSRPILPNRRADIYGAVIPVGSG